MYSDLCVNLNTFEQRSSFACTLHVSSSIVSESAGQFLHSLRTSSLVSASSNTFSKLQQLQYIHACFYRACELLTSFPSINSSLNPTNTMFMPTNYSTLTQILYKMKTFSSLPVIPRTKYIFFVWLNNKIKPSLPVC